MKFLIGGMNVMACLAVSALGVNMQVMKVRFTVSEACCIISFLFKYHCRLMAVETEFIIIHTKFCGEFTSKFRPQEHSVF
jgi:hypothetical protein